jgi:nitroreductase
VDTLLLASPAVPARARRPRLTLWGLRLVTALHLCAVLVQPLLAGRFLTGDVDAIGLHGAVGLLVVLSGLVLAVTALGYVAVVRGRWWLVPVAAALFLAEGLQLGMGTARALQVHVPLGVAITVTATLLAGWAWSPAARRPQ